MWSWIKLFKYYLVTIIEIAFVIIQAISHYIFSTTEKNIRNETVLITGSGGGLGTENIKFYSIFIFEYRSTNGISLC